MMSDLPSNDDKGTPRWVKLMAIFAAVIIASVICLHLLFGGEMFGGHMVSPS